MIASTQTADPAVLPVVVIGAGPVGLAAAAHLADRRMHFMVLEAGPGPGATVLQWGHIRTFTPWRYITDPTAERLLAPTGWTRPPTPVPPTGAELVEHYLRPLSMLLGPQVRFGHRVLAVSRDGMDKSRSLGRAERPFVLRVRDDTGTVVDVRARAVIDASGTWEHPNPLGASGLPAAGEADAGDVLVGPLPDVLGAGRDRFAGRTTLVVGAGHSAANTLLSLGRLAADVPGTRVLWAIRGADPSRVYGGGVADELAARGRLGTDLRALVESGAVELLPGLSITALTRDSRADSGSGSDSDSDSDADSGSDAGSGGGGGGNTVTVIGETASGVVRVGGVHHVAAATGFRPDLTMLAELRLDLDPGLEAPRALAPLIDPAFHSCGTVPPHGHRDLSHPEPGFYVVGMKSYGRAPTFLITTGNEQVRSVVAALAGDTVAADDVRLVLPETGVCSVDARGQDTAGAGGTGGCCGTDTGVVGLEVPAAAHRLLPVGVPAQGFATGATGGGRLAELVLTDVTPPASQGSCGTGGCCAG